MEVALRESSSLSFPTADSNPAAPVTEPPVAAGPRYEPNERPPLLVTAGLGLQFAAISAADLLIAPVTVARSSGVDTAYLEWMVFATLVTVGVGSLLQVVRVGPVGAGVLHPMYTSFAAIPLCIAALVDGGPATLTTLVLVSAVFQVVIARRLFLLRRIVTPTVYGTVLMIVALAVASVMFRLLNMDAAAAGPGVPAAALVTIAVVVGLSLRGPKTLRLWAPLLSIAAGSACAAAFGLFDTERVTRAPWAGLPPGGWPTGLGLDVGTAFWTLLPAFLFLSVIFAFQMGGASIGLQRVSWRRARAIDFRTVQQTISTAGLSNLAAGLAGTVPNTSGWTVLSFIQITGAASRAVGYCIGGAFIALAFLPKASGLLSSIPDPVIAGFAIATTAFLFSEGMRIVVRDGLDPAKGLVVGISLLVGASSDFGLLPQPDLPPAYVALLGSGLTTGGITAIILTLLVQVTGQRRLRFRSRLDVAALPDLNAFLARAAARCGWSASTAARVSAAAEEILLTLAPPEGGPPEGGARRMVVLASGDDEAAELEVISAAGEQNLEDRVRQLQEHDLETPRAQDLSLHLLQHYASSVRHQQYHEADVITIRVLPR